MLQKSDSNIVTPSELMELCAVDYELFEREFFPEAVRQPNAVFHREVWKLLESSARLVNIQMFRGSAKTTKLRIFTIRRIAYGIARTILIVCLSEKKAIQTLDWIRKQIEHNYKLSQVFDLHKGKKWTEVGCEIEHGLMGHTVSILAYGIGGSIRGINIDNWRPDLIIVDDICDEENTSTEDQRNKTEDLVYGALDGSLAPEVDSPDAKMVLLQTPFNLADVSTKALSDPAWASARHSCWTPETAHLMDDEKESSWESRFPTDLLRTKKNSFLLRNKASVWSREYEVNPTSPETCSFISTWLQHYDLLPDRRSLHIVGAIDPVPPPTDKQIAKGLKGKDYEVLGILGISKDGRYYLMDYAVNRGHEPNWTLAQFFQLGMKWNPSAWVVEETAYQKTLEWILKEGMKKKKIYFPIFELADSRSKYDRIVDTISDLASMGLFYVHKSHTEFISQFNDYPNVLHDDILDMASMGIKRLRYFDTGNLEDSEKRPSSNVVPFRADNDRDIRGTAVSRAYPKYGYGAP